MVPAGDCSVPLGASFAEGKLDQNVPLKTQSVSFPGRVDTIMLTSPGDLSGRLRLTSYPEQPTEEWRAAVYAIFTC